MNDGSPQDRVYVPAGPTVERFHASDVFVRFLMGPIGSGKSYACVNEILRRAGLQRKGPDGKRHTRWAVIRSTYPQLRDTTIKTFKDIVTLGVGKWNMNPPMTWKLETADMDVEVIFLALDQEADVAKLLSLELTGGFINEARDVPKAIFDALCGRVDRYPSKANGGCTWSGVILDSNPCADDHWLYKLFANEADRPSGYEFFHQPSGLSPQAENLQNLNSGRAYYIRLLAGRDDEWVKVFVHGSWGHVLEGTPVYYSYRDGTHCAPAPLQPIEGLPLIIGVDWGLTPAALIMQRASDGRWLVLSEVCMEEAGVVRFAQALTAHVALNYPGFRVAAVYADPAGQNRVQTDERTNIEVFKEHTGWKTLAAPLENNSWSMRLEAVLTALGRMVDGKPGLLISPACTVLRKGMNGGYHYRELRTSLDGLSHDEHPAKNFPSHVCEALQYALVGGGEADVVLNKVKRKERRANSPGYGNRTDYDVLDYSHPHGRRRDARDLPYEYWKHDHAN